MPQKMTGKRIQLTLFVDEHNAGSIEKIRSTYNPEQYARIRSHVTLCREEELRDIEHIQQNLTQLNHHCITIEFGNVTRFAAGKGVMIPAAGTNTSFYELRKAVLQGISSYPVQHEPHITLMHPRNATCTDDLFHQLQQVQLPRRLTFCTISLIEQEHDGPWRILNEFTLINP